MSGKDAVIFLLLGWLVLSDVACWLSVNDLYRFDGYRREDIQRLQEAVGEMGSCMRYPKNTDNLYCPNPNWEPRQ